MRTAGVKLLQQRQSVPCVRAPGAQVLRTEGSTSCAHLGRPWGRSVSPGSWLQWELSRSPSKGTLSLVLSCIPSFISGCRGSAPAPHPGSPWRKAPPSPDAHFSQVMSGVPGPRKRELGSGGASPHTSWKWLVSYQSGRAPGHLPASGQDCAGAPAASTPSGPGRLRLPYRATQLRGSAAIVRAGGRR